MQFLNKKIMYVAGSFLAGFSVMTVELISSRIVAPIIGSSVFTWTSVIGITLCGLSLGSWIGGKIADKVKNDEILSLSFLISAIFVAIIPLLSKNTDFITSSSDSILKLNLLLSFYLFLLPALSIGLIQPLILKRYTDDFSKIGSRYGILSSVWSVGSLIGVFLTGFLFISTIGSSDTIWLTAIILFLTGLPFAIGHKKALVSFLIIAILIPITLWGLQKNAIQNKSILFQKETSYYDAKVVDTTLPFVGNSRILFLDFDSHSIETKKSNESFYPEMYPLFADLKTDIKNILVIGAGAYTMPKHFKDYYQGATVSVIETDKELIHIGNDYFNLGDYDIHTIVGDARIIIRKSEEKYDVIFGDAYNSFISVPWYLLTREWNDTIKERLNDGGIYAINFIGSFTGDKKEFPQSVFDTFKISFPNLYVFSFGTSAETTQNIVLVGVKGNLPMSEKELYQKLLKGESSFLAHQLRPIDILAKSKSVILTDDFSPVEKLLAPSMKEFFPKNLSYMKEISNPL